MTGESPDQRSAHGATRGIAAILLTAVLLAGPAQAARWSYSAAEDLDEVLSPAPGRGRVESPPANAPKWSPGIASWLGQAASSTMATVVDVVSIPVSAVGSRLSVTASTLNQFTWEVAYVLGINSTPVEPISVSDPGHSAFHDPLAVEGKPAAPPAAATPPAEPPAEPPRMRVAEPPPRPPIPAVVPVAVEPTDTRTLAGLAFDKSQRRPDGSYFVPKPLQRLFEIRTLKADTTHSPLTVRLPGRIVPDPNAHGDVEASLLGRIEPPKTGFPVLGEVVRQGQILGYVAPAVGVVDRTQVRREVARLTNEIRIAAESLEILKQFWFVPFRDGKIIQAETKLDGLRRERAALLPMLQTQEVLRAASDGVISVSNAINGRVVHPGEKIFEIVSPKRLWIEAVAADPDVARDAASVESAFALTPEGETLDLAFIGSGLALQQQSVPLMFRINDPIEGLRVGRPVTVTVRNRSKLHHGIPVPREALVADSSGAEQVWELVAPEIFMPHTVKTETLDGRSVLIVAGVAPGARIVTRGSRLLSQLQ